MFLLEADKHPLQTNSPLSDKASRYHGRLCPQLIAFVTRSVLPPLLPLIAGLPAPTYLAVKLQFARYTHA